MFLIAIFFILIPHDSFYGSLHTGYINSDPVFVLIVVWKTGKNVFIFYDVFVFYCI